MTTPPEKCPVCGAGMFVDVHLARQFECHAIWAGYSGYVNNRWSSPCEHAMTAALRCGATLHPTAREQAREALVAAGEHLNFESRQILAAYSQLARAGVINKDAWAGFGNSVEAHTLAHAAYLATVTP